MVPGPLFEVAVRLNADHRHRQLLAPQRPGQRPEITGNITPAVDVLHVVGVDDRVAGHAPLLPDRGSP